MKAEAKVFPAVILIHLAGFLFLAASFCINPLEITRAFFSDEAVYYTMAYSFAEDGDMEYERKDLIRVYKEFAAGPQGIILKINERDKTIVFGKSYLYGLVAAPFVSVLKTNGFFALHAVLLWLNLLCAYRFCLSIMGSRMAVLFSFFYFIANATLVYLFWMTPEYFNMSLICYGFFFFIAAEQLNSKFKLFQSPYNYYIAAIFFAMATYSKPTNAVLILPIGIWMLYKRKILAAMITLTIFIGTTVALFGGNVYLTGDWNYQAGNRSAFYTRFPYDRPGASPFALFKRRIPSIEKPPFVLKNFAHNWLYFPFGRFSGFAIYFLPMFFVLIYFLFSKKDSLSKAVYIAGWLGILSYMIGIPWNYFGGSGTIGNRYLLNAFAVLLFALRQEPSRRLMFAGFCGSLLFTSAFLFTPVMSSFDNSFHQKRSVFRSLPLEKSLLSDLPINTNIRARRVVFDDPATYFAYFTDDNTYFMEPHDHYFGFWVKGERKAEVVLRSFQPVTRLKVKLQSLQPGNEVTINVEGESKKINLKEEIFYEGEIPLPEPYYYDRDGTGKTYLYLVKVSSKGGKIVNDNYGERYLGAFVRFELPEAEAISLPEEESEQEDVEETPEP